MKNKVKYQIGQVVKINKLGLIKLKDNGRYLDLNGKFIIIELPDKGHNIFSLVSEYSPISEWNDSKSFDEQRNLVDLHLQNQFTSEKIYFTPTEEKVENYDTIMKIDGSIKKFFNL